MYNIESNEILFENLKQIEVLKNKLIYLNNIIYIKFHKDCQIAIKFNKYFKIYINNIFYYDIEGQDIFESIKDIVNDNWIFVEKVNFINKKKILLIPKNKFTLRSVFLNNKFRKAFSINELLYDISKIRQ